MDHAFLIDALGFVGDLPLREALAVKGPDLFMSGVFKGMGVEQVSGLLIIFNGCTIRSRVEGVPKEVEVPLLEGSAGFEGVLDVLKALESQSEIPFGLRALEFPITRFQGAPGPARY